MAMVGLIFKLPLMRSVQVVVAAVRAWNVCFWHLADNLTAPAFVRFWTKADKIGFSPRTLCRLMTQSGH